MRWLACFKRRGSRECKFLDKGAYILQVPMLWVNQLTDTQNHRYKTEVDAGVKGEQIRLS
mgnify:CR=1 FL=1